MPLEKCKHTLLPVPLSSVINIQAATDLSTEKDHRLLSSRLSEVCLPSVDAAKYSNRVRHAQVFFSQMKGGFFDSQNILEKI